MKSETALYLPGKEQFKKINERLPAFLETHDFHLQETLEKKFGALRAICFIATR